MDLSIHKPACARLSCLATSRFLGKEISGYAEHFNNLCRMQSHFKRAEPADVAEILETLVTMGRAHQQDGKLSR